MAKPTSRWAGAFSGNGPMNAPQVIPEVARVERPPYRVPLMAEIKAVPWNGRTIVSTFSGCGGSCLGFRMAGFRVGWANEFVERARASYLANCDAATILDGRNIRDVRAPEILDAIGLAPGELDVFEGSPPCVDFSTAGKRQQGWGKRRQHADGSVDRADDLFLVWADLLRELQPKCFVSENVTGLIKGVAKGYFTIILAALRDCGYLVESRILDAQWLGVPQARQRVLFMGVRRDLHEQYGARPAWPSPLPYRYSVRDALPWLGAGQRVVEDTGGQFSSGDVTERCCVTVRAGGVGHLRVEGSAEMIVGNTSEALAEFDRLRNGEPLRRVAPSRLGKGAWSVHVCDPEKPSPTLTHASQGNDVALAEVPDQSIVIRAAFGEDRVCSIDEPAPTVTTDGLGPANKNRCVIEGDMRGTAVGREWERLRVGGQSEKYFQLVRSDPDRPCGTITALGGNVGLASVAHPYECRKFTIAELRRIGAFPDDFVLIGSYSQQWARIGNSVPPIMMRAVAEVIRDVVLKDVP